MKFEFNFAAFGRNCRYRKDHSAVSDESLIITLPSVVDDQVTVT